MDTHIPVIVITGGPNGGKTTLLNDRLPRALRKLGYTIEIVPEAATLLMTEGVDPLVVGMEEFQRHVLTRSLELEQNARDNLRGVKGKKVILTDRGVMDGAAYIDPNLMKAIWEEYGFHPVELRDKRYTAVLHLESTAIGLPHLFSNESNPTRYEATAEEAARVDRRTLAAWIGCPHLAYIDNSTDFEGKIERAIAWVKYFLGSKEHERKFLLNTPFERALLPIHAQKVDIRQSYIKMPGRPKSGRIRARGQDGKHIHWHTTKTGSVGMSCTEDEVLISKEDYRRLHKRHSLPDHAEIVKQRWCFVENGYYWELDVFRDWEYVLIEVELPDPLWEVTLPSWMEGVVVEVTGQKPYTNKSIARVVAEKMAA